MEGSEGNSRLRGYNTSLYLLGPPNSFLSARQLFFPCPARRFCPAQHAIALLPCPAQCVTALPCPKPRAVALPSAPARLLLALPVRCPHAARSSPALPSAARVACSLLARPAQPSCPTKPPLTAAAATTVVATATTVTAAMATPTVLTFDDKGHPVDFKSWLGDLHSDQQSFTREDVSLFEHTSGSLDAPADSAARVDRSTWTSRDATAALAVRSHLPLDQRTHFRQLKTAKALYGAVVKRYLSPSSATVGRLALPFLFPELLDITTRADLLTHLRSLGTRYAAALEPAFLTTRLPDSLRAVRDHFLALDPTKITLASFESRLLEAESAALAVAASRRNLLPSVFEGCSPFLLALSVASAAVLDLLGAEEVGAASAPRVVGVAGATVVVAEVVVVGEEKMEAAEEEEEVVGVVGVVEGVGVALEVEQAEEELEVRPLVQLRLVMQRVVEVAMGVVSSSSRADKYSSHRSSFVSGRSDLAAQVAQLAAGPSPLAPSYASAAAVDVPSAEDVGAASTSAKNLVATFVLQDQWVTDTQPGGELMAICTDSRTGEHLATFTRRPGSGLYTLTTESAHVAESGQVVALVEVLAPTSEVACTALPSLRRGMAARRSSFLLVSSSFPPTTAPLQTLHMDVWGPAHVTGQGGERYFLLVVGDYTRYTTVFPLQSKAYVRGVWIR
ncbi:unnamed protein product [Closterium sp. NIES-54]